MKKGLSEPNSAAIGERVSNLRAARIWKLAQRCAQNGTLQDLKDGRLDELDKNESASAQPLSTSAPEAPASEKPAKRRKPNRSTKHHDNDVMEERGTDSKSIDLEGPRSTSPGARIAENKKKVSSIEKDAVELSHRGEEIVHVDRNNSESDGGLILNTCNDQNTHSEGEISDSEHEMDHPNCPDDRRGDEHYVTEGGVNNESQDMDSDSQMDPGSDSGEGDAMMSYSNSEQAIKDGTDRSKRTNRPEFKPAHILAELSSQDLNIQMRYFHITKQADEVDLNTPVRCLVCAQHGHMAEVCGSLTCQICGLHNDHTSQNCPSTMKCAKCREVGHDRPRCPYKLKNMATNEIVCDLCQRNGHTEEDCELVWRTSGRPWELDLGKENVRLSCYECGRSGHLGNDCPTRRPGKSLGSSTWGSGKGQISIVSKYEIRIKGSARQDLIDVDDDDDEMTSHFVRPKLPKPARKGKIQIKTGSTASNHSNAPQSGWGPTNTTYEPNSATYTYNDPQRDDERDRWRASNGLAQSANSDYARYNSYRPSDRRSVSPEYRDRSGYARSDRYQPSAPPSTSLRRRPLANGDVYRPMPSSAQNAWSRHRM